jgi:ATP-binding cassette subfamily B protein
MFHFRFPEGQSVPHSGLTGPADIPEPPPERPRDLRSRLGQLRQGASATLIALPRVLELVWHASPGLTIGLASATVLSGVIPAATAYLSKELLNAVIKAIAVHGQHAPDVTQVGPFPITTTTIGAIVWLAAAQFVIFGASSAMSTVRNITQQLLQERMTLQIQLQIMEHASRLDLAFFEDSGSYDLLRRAQEEATSRPLMMVSQAFGLIQTTITFVTMIAVLIHVSWVLAVVALVAPIPAFISDTRYGWRGFNLARWASPLRRRMQYLLTLSTTDTAAKEVKLFDLGDHLVERFKLLSSTYYERQRRLVTTRYVVGNLWSLISTLVGSGTYLYVALQAVAGRLTPGDLLLYVQAATQIQNSVQGILSGLSSMYENNLYLTNLFDLLDVESRIKPPETPRPLPAPLRGEVVFEQVSFRYPGGASGDALREVSFRIVPGETIAVVGRNGAGKSTLIKLLCRLYDPSHGRILLDGTDIREFDPAQLRSVMSAMFQDFVTYQATASENIGLGHLEQLENQLAIVAAAGRGGASELIEGLRSGYDTPLGKWFDQGVNLSGGEWQKVALGRAFMRDEARILVLDEPTSALDAQAEYDLFTRLRQLSEGRTAIYISHRFSTVRQADRILFLEHGRLVEDGTHQELMALGGRYARLFALQASAYTGEEVLSEDLPA